MRCSDSAIDRLVNSALLPAVLQGPTGQAAAEGTAIAASVRGSAEQRLNTTRVLDMLLPQELPSTELGKHANPANMQSASLVDAQASAAATDRSSPTSTSSPMVSSHNLVAAPSTSPQQQLPSPAGKVATKPFTGPPPAALAQQQSQQPQAAQQSGTHHLAAAAAATTAGLLELSLSAEQIALLQAAADNAQSYLDRDAAAVSIGTEQAHVATSGEGFSRLISDLVELAATQRCSTC